ncbi:MAG: hypothetical protein ACOZCP_19305 [Pseudomonadota bacterium]
MSSSQTPVQQEFFSSLPGGAASGARKASAPRRGLDERLNEVLPGDHRLWSQDEKDIFVVRLAGMLVEDMMEMFESHHERTDAGLVFRDEEDRADFIATLGWVCGYWKGVVSFDLVMKMFGFDPRVIREAVMEAYACDLHLAQEVFADKFTLH